MNKPLKHEHLQAIYSSLERWAGLTHLDRSLIEKALAASDAAREALAFDYVEVYALRDAVTRTLIDAPWSHAPETQARLRDAAAIHGFRFTPPAERVDLSMIDPDDLREAMSRHYMLVVSDDALRDAFHADPDLYAGILDLNDSIAWDTMLRESLGGALTRLLVGRAWPTYGEGEQVQQYFLAALEERQRPDYLAFCSEPADLIQRAGYCRDRGDASSARRLLDQALAADPDVRGATCLRADIALLEDDHTAALNAIQPLFERSDDAPGILAHLIRGKALAGLDRGQEAIAALEHVVSELDPSRNRRVTGLPSNCYEQALTLVTKLSA